MNGSTQPPVVVFCSYAHEDERFLDELKKHLALLDRQGAIEWWHDRAIRPGEDWLAEIERQLDRAGIVLLLVSNDFLASSVCYDVELPRALARHDAGQTRVIPIIVRDADWTGASFAPLNALPRDGRPIENWEHPDEAYRSIAVALREEIERIRSAPPPTARASRKTVTVVSFALGRATDDVERVSADRERDIVAAALGREGDAVRAEAGLVSGFFGVPRVQGDDALRAVRAAYDAAAAVKALASAGARGGIATGEALVRLAEGNLVTGGVLGTAAELAWAAPDGAVLLNDDTHALVKRMVAVEHGELRSGVGAHRLVELVEATPFEAAFVGRAADSTALDHSFAQTVLLRRPLLFTLVGDAGIGKSRLVREFRVRVESHANVTVGRCRAEPGAAYLPAVEAIHGAVGLSGDDDTATARGKICRLLEGDQDRELIADRILELIGRAEPQSSRDETFWAVRKLLHALARRRPLVLVFDDVHNAQPALLTLIEEIADLMHDSPILLICIGRREFLEQHADWGGGKPNTASAQLDALSDEECARLAEDIAGASLPRRLLDRLVELAEGNPLYVAETIAMLVDGGVIIRHGGRVGVKGDVDAIAIPGSIKGLVRARFELLPAAERDVLERASVEGRVFHAGAVAALAGDAASDDVGALLVTLVRKDILRHDEPRVPGETAFRFRHALLREEAYDSLPKGVRRSLHERLADWLERTVGDRPVGQEFIGFHLGQAVMLAVELGSSDDHSHALSLRGGRHLAAAGRRAATRGDAPAALDLLRRAVELLAGTPEQPAVELDLATALLQCGHGSEAEVVFDRLIEAASTGGDKRLEWYARLEKAGIEYDRRPELGAEWLRSEVERGRDVFEELGDDTGVAKAWRLLGYLDVVAARWEAARNAYERAYDCARRAGNKRDELAAIGALFFSAVMGPALVEPALDYCAELVERAPDSRSIEALGLASRGALLAMVEQFDEARRLAAESRSILEDLGQVRRTADASSLWASVELLAGDPEAAVTCLRRAARIARRTGDVGQRTTIAAFLAEALHAGGRDRLAARAALFIAATADERDVVSQFKWRQVLAAVIGDHAPEDSERYARAAVAMAQTTDDLNGLADALVVLARMLRKLGRTDEALGVAADAEALYRRKGNIAAAKRFALTLEEMSTVAAAPPAA